MPSASGRRSRRPRWPSTVSSRCATGSRPHWSWQSRSRSSRRKRRPRRISRPRQGPGRRAGSYARSSASSAATPSIRWSRPTATPSARAFRAARARPPSFSIALLVPALVLPNPQASVFWRSASISARSPKRRRTSWTRSPTSSVRAGRRPTHVPRSPTSCAAWHASCAIDRRTWTPSSRASARSRTRCAAASIRRPSSRPPRSPRCRVR